MMEYVISDSWDEKYTLREKIKASKFTLIRDKMKGMRSKYLSDT